MAYKQNLQGAQGGTIQGAHGGTQQLGGAAMRRLGSFPGPNTAGGGLNPNANGNMVDYHPVSPSGTPSITDFAQKPGTIPWTTGGPEGAPGMQVKPMALPGFQKMDAPTGEAPIFLPPGAMGGGMPGPGDIPPGMGRDISPTGMHPLNPAAYGAPPVVDLPGRPGMFGSGAMQGVGNATDQMQQHGGAPPFQGTGGADPLPGFTAAPGQFWGATGGPLMSLPGPAGKFPPRPGLPTKPLPAPEGAPPTAGGGINPAGPRPRNNMARY